MKAIVDSWDSAVSLEDSQRSLHNVHPDDNAAIVVKHELGIMRQSADYIALEKYVSSLIQRPKALIRVSERFDHAEPDSAYSIGDSIIPVYKPSAGKIHWIVEDEDKGVHIVYYSSGVNRKIVDSVVQVDVNAICSDIESGAGNYNVHTVYPSTDMISIWTPESSKHILVYGLWSLRENEWYKPNDNVHIPRGIREIAALTRPAQ